MSLSPALDWADSGLMALTGPADGAPLVPRYDAIGAIGSMLDEFEQVAGRRASSRGLDLRLLTERAHLMGLTRGGRESCNRHCRLIEARDGWLALNLPRPSDREMLLPWLGVDAGDEPWPEVERAVRARDVGDLLAAADGLPLAVSAVPMRAASTASSRGPASTTRRECMPILASGAGARSRSRRARDPGIGSARVVVPAMPRVLDLSALWAGPLCGRLLALAGARVIRVESLGRPEATRQDWPEVFDRLNAGKESVALDFADPRQLRILRRLIARADIVIGSARPRAFEQLGLDPRECLAADPRLVWIAITAHGWHGDAGQRVGFGDDAAAAAGLVAVTPDGRPAFVGDAIADPLTGIAAATTALRAWSAGQGGLHDVSLRGTAARVAAAPRLEPRDCGELCRRSGAWWLRVGGRERRVASPSWRRTSARAAAFGSDTRRIVEEFN